MNESRLSEFWQNSMRHRSFCDRADSEYDYAIYRSAFLVLDTFSCGTAGHTAQVGKVRPQSIGWGTDHFGRDVFSMLMVGAWNSMLVSIFAIGFGAGIGVPLGALAAAKRGWVEETVMRFNDFAFAFPALLTAVMLSAVYGPGTINSVLAIGISIFRFLPELPEEAL